MDWPKQNTGVFAVATCAFCEVENLFSLREYDSLDGMEPAGKYYIGYDTTEAQGIVAAEANGPAPWNLISTGYWRWGSFCGSSIATMTNTDFKNADLDYTFTDTWEPSDDTFSCFEYRRLRFKRELSGLNPNTAYSVSMNVERRPIGGTWAAYATLTDTVTTDATGRLIWEDDVPHSRGYETWIAARTFAAVPA